VFTQAALPPLPHRIGRAGFEQAATQAPLLHVKVPFAGRAGQVAHALPQSIVPGGQLLHIPPLQFVPVGHTLPHWPQFFGSLEVSTSQPVAGLRSQSAMGGLHIGLLQTPPAQVSVPPVMLQRMPHTPQLAGSTAVWISQPLAGLWSQSAYPELHEAMVHAEPTHFSKALFVLHAAPHAPQLLESVVTFTHDAAAALPQSVGRVLGQVSPQAGGVPAHVGWPPAGAGQTLQVVPHELVDVEASGTQVPLQL
jgi:hypothetical protein